MVQWATRRAPGIDKGLCNAEDVGMPSTDLIGSADACTILGIDRSTLSRWVAAGKLTPIQRVSAGPTAAFLFRRIDVERLATETQVAS